jgi:hypothetical protein
MSRTQWSFATNELLRFRSIWLIWTQQKLGKQRLWTGNRRLEWRELGPLSDRQRLLPCNRHDATFSGFGVVAVVENSSKENASGCLCPHCRGED